MTTSRKLALIAIVPIMLGLAGMVPLAYYWTQNKVAVAQSSKLVVPATAPAPVPTPTLVTGKPGHLLISSLGINLGVVDGVYNEKSAAWTLSSDKAHYALPTTLANNENGNTLIYGHYRPEVFARLHLIKEGAEAVITTDNGYRFIYTYRSKQAVSPSDTSIFTYTGPAQLTVQTCTGAFMQHRELYYFSFTRYEKI